MVVVTTERDVRSETNMTTVGPLLGCAAEAESFPDMLLNDVAVTEQSEDVG